MKPLEVLGALTFLVLVVWLVAAVSGKGGHTSADLDREEAPLIAKLERERTEAAAKDRARVVLATRNASCRASADCEVRGRCTYREPEFLLPEDVPFSVDQCVATTNEDCRRAKGCTAFGWCSVEPSMQRCYIASDADCAMTEKCQKRGMCTRAIDRIDTAYNDPFDRTCWASTKDCDSEAMKTAGKTCLAANGRACVPPIKGKCRE